ncbi:uncharacterized protein BT62DRAFT_938769 [Guyanagaster necrorhizus]|uniref:Uncharacterized protein n=1 Tax=Guyanagaster necrorhizus TaxID=856835 RepID=A0A9P7VFD5_9AGAR|nr:uncharacterized protein BT62DRAFT_938769 [Guyanagaster necrorhizus MCA 3950]KAG7439689.1 hypothetical protein BT62DRAFT_938769 [Guyanagaster necrorhizus MCA 3950]
MLLATCLPLIPPHLMPGSSLSFSGRRWMTHTSTQSGYMSANSLHANLHPLILRNSTPGLSP